MMQEEGKGLPNLARTGRLVPDQWVLRLRNIYAHLQSNRKVSRKPLDPEIYFPHAHINRSAQLLLINPHFFYTSFYVMVMTLKNGQ